MDNYANNIELGTTITAQKKFFLQRWLEILHENTHSTYSIKFLNSHVVLREIYNISREVLQGKTREYHLETVIKEAKEVLEKDTLFQGNDKPLFDRVKRVLDKKGTETKHNLYALIYQLKGIIETLDEKYLGWLLYEIRYYLIYSEPADYKVLFKELENIENLIEMLISELIEKGWSREGLYSVMYGFVHKFKSSKSKSFFYKPSEWDKLFRTLKSNNNEFICAFPFEGKVNREELKKLEIINLNVVNGKEIINKYPNVNKLAEHIKGDGVYILDNKTTYDRFEAINISWRDILKRLDILQFYGYKYEKPSNKPLVIIPGWNKFYMRKAEASTYSIQIFKAPVSLINQALTIMEKGKSNNSEKIKSVLEFTRISHESMSSQSTFLNLWIALEFFVKSKEFNNDLHSVSEIVSSAVASRYIYDLIKNFYDDCERCAIQYVTNFNDDISSKDKVEYMLSILIDQTKSNALLADCHKFNILLGYRCRSLIVMIKDHKGLVKKIENHEKKVKYQIQRLYRIRNSIVHTADTNNNLNLFTRCLNEYLQKTVNETFFRLSKNHENTIEEVHSLIVQAPKAVCDVLSHIDKKDNDAYQRVLVDGIF